MTHDTGTGADAVIDTTVLIERMCPTCCGVGWRRDLPLYFTDTTCNDCKGNGCVWVTLQDATDEELRAARQAKWEDAEEAEQEAREQAREALLIETELTRRESKHDSTRHDIHR